MDKTWIQEMIERLQKTAKYIKDKREEGIQDLKIIESIDFEAVEGVFLLCTNGYLKLKKKFFKDYFYSTQAYKDWHKVVLKRDCYTCQNCSSRGGKLEVHHIKPKSLFPELALDEDNGQTLCRNCHVKTDSYGGKIRTYSYGRI